MATRFNLPFADVGSGIKPSDGAQLFFYVASTDTPKDTFTTSAASVANSNPVVANAIGVFPAIFLIGDYWVTLKDKNDVQIWAGVPISSNLSEASATIAALIADVSVQAGVLANTAGYHAAGDDGAGTYLPKTASQATSDGDVIDGYANHAAANGLKLILQPVNNTINLAQVGMRSSVNGAAMLQTALASDYKVRGIKDALYNIESGVTISDVSIDFDLNGCSLINTSATERMLIVEYPYLNINAITAVDLPGQNVTLTSITGYEAGKIVKIVSGDRCPGNRPAEAGGENYWQSQTLTVDSIAGLVVSFREPFEEDFTFATSPKIMIYSPKSCNIYNGSAYSEKGFEATRSNGLFRVKGGVGSSINVKVENSNGTAIEYWGVDSPVNSTGDISNVGRSTDTSGSHGISHISCITPKVLNTTFRRTRHGQTNNDTPTLYSTNDYYVMGPTYDLLVTGCHNSGDIVGAFSTHHGIRRALFANNSVSGSAIAGGFRGRDVTVRGLKTIGVEKAAFFYSEDGVATVDKTTRWFLDGVESKDSSVLDLQVQKCLIGTLGTNIFKGGAPNGWFLNEGGTVVLQGSNEFFSNGTFDLDDNFLHTVDTNVEIFGVLSIDIDSMTVNGTNNVIRSTGTRFFKSYGKIICEEPVGMDNIFKHIGTGETLLTSVEYINDIGYPFNIASTIAKASGQTFDDSYSTKFLIFTASASYALSLNEAGDEEITVTLLTDAGEYTLASIDNGNFRGQKLLLRAVDSTGTYGFILNASITNLNLNGANLTIADGESRRFFWSGSSWIIESRNA